MVWRHADAVTANRPKTGGPEIPVQKILPDRKREAFHDCKGRDWLYRNSLINWSERFEK
jgi:hypothetical protein